MQFHPEAWPIFLTDPEQQWEVRYYDTLRKPCLHCLEVARFVIDYFRRLSFGAFSNRQLLPVRNREVQVGKTDGLWILHFIEEEARFFLGEERGTKECNLAYRRFRINQMQQALLLRSDDAPLMVEN